MREKPCFTPHPTASGGHLLPQGEKGNHDLPQRQRHDQGDQQTALGERQWFAGEQFSAADILMATVLRGLRHTDILADYPALNAYLERCTARPAFRRALAEQMAPFKANEPA